MKKSVLFAFAASSLLFCACGGDSNVVSGESQNNAVQQITLQVASSGDGMTSRAGRPLESSEADQDIQHVKVIVCDDANQVKYTSTIDNWSTSGSTVYGSTTSAHGREATLTIPEAERLAAGTYKVYAIGYSDPSDYGLDAITGIAKDATFNENMAISLSGTDKKVEEIFAGSTANFKIESDKKAEGTVVLNRQVAGSYGYVKDIPYVAGATELQLVASTGNTQLVLGNFASYDLAGNGTNNDEHVNYVINGGTPETGEQVIYTIDLTKWFTNIKDEDNNGLIDVDGNWISEGHATYAEGSAFAGEFIIPFDKTDGQTFTLKLVNPTTHTVAATWNVNLPEGDGQLSAHSVAAWGGTSFTTTADVVDSKNSYSVVRNHLYGIGVRTSKTPDNPGKDPEGDDPQSLKKAQSITLKVNDNWEVIHKMEIE